MRRWYIPDAYWPTGQDGTYVSHEAVCVLNPTQQEARLTMTLFFEDRDKLEGFAVHVGAERTVHVRMDRIENNQHITVPRDTPYAIMLESETEDLMVQYTRVDTTQSNLAIATTVV